MIVSLQPTVVLKKNLKFTVAVRLLIGDRLGIRQQLVKKKVYIRICTEEQARRLAQGMIGVNEM
jgi:hypothetical protein